MYSTRWSEEHDAALKMGLELGFSPAELSRHYAPRWVRTKGAVYLRAQYVQRPQVVMERVVEAGRAMRHGTGRIVERLRDARIATGVITEGNFSDRTLGRRFMAWGDRVIEPGLSDDEAVRLAEELDVFLEDLAHCAASRIAATSRTAAS